MTTIDSLSSSQCCGCAACKDRCPVHAIVMADDGEGNRRAIVDNQVCIRCGLCMKTCPQNNSSDAIPYEKKAYVCHYNNKELAIRSSSGGVFIALARYVIGIGGIVYGAAMKYEDGQLLCKHVRINSQKDLPQLQGSKYVQSITDGIYLKVKKDLNDGKTVLFSGTSCQVAALKRFMGNHEKLWTVDLVCHGVPRQKLFRDYLAFLGKNYNCNVTDVAFRSKGIMSHGKEMRFMLTVQCKDSKSHYFTKTLYSKKSAYYQLFLHRAGYRDSCYHCVYATKEKPGDITVGDFMPRKQEFIKYGFSSMEHESSVIVHTEQGAAMLEAVKEKLTIVPISMEEMLSHHPNLVSPSVATVSGGKMYRYYLAGGFQKLQKHVNIDYAKSRMKEFIKRCMYSLKP